MNFTTTSVGSSVEILKRKLGAELIVPFELDDDAFTNGLCKAGTPINADGEKATTTTSEGTSTNDAIGILLNDVYSSNPNGALIKAFACVNATVGASHSGVTYDNALKSALPLIVFE